MKSDEIVSDRALSLSLSLVMIVHNSSIMYYYNQDKTKPTTNRRIELQLQLQLLRSIQPRADGISNIAHRPMRSDVYMRMWRNAIDLQPRSGLDRDNRPWPSVTLRYAGIARLAIIVSTFHPLAVKRSYYRRGYVTQRVRLYVDGQLTIGRMSSTE